MKNFTNKILLSGLILISASLPVFADIIWPSIYITKGMLSIQVILLGLIEEWIFVKHFAKLNWNKAFIITFFMNLISAIIGLFLIPLSGLCSEFIFDFVFHTYDKFGIGTFHWSHWFISYLLVIIINTLIEGLFIKKSLKLELKRTFWWLSTANAISILICLLYLLI